MIKKLQRVLLVPALGLGLGLGLGLFVALMLTWLVNPEPVAAQSDVFVRLNGSDLNCDGETDVDYSVAAAPDCAFETIQHGIDQVATGGTVNVAGGAGVYDQAFIIDKALLLVGSAGATVSVNQNTICASVVADNVTIDGMTFADCDIAILAEADSPGYTNLHIMNNTIYNTSRFGVYLGVSGERFADGRLTMLRDFTGLQVIDNTIYDTGHAPTGYAALVLQGMRSTGVRHNISGNEIYSATASGIWIDTAHNISVQNNDVHDNNWAGIYISSYADGYDGGAEDSEFGPRDIEVIANNLRRNMANGVKITDGWPGEMSFHHNAIVDTVAGDGFDNHPLLNDVTAQNNWWGCNAGPNNSFDCDTFNGNVVVEPWLTLGLVADPSSLSPGGGVTAVALTASLTHNSDGVDTSGSGYIPDGTAVQFESSVGAIDPPLTVTTVGVANATIPVDPNPGSVVISATVDHQTVTTTITILDYEYFLPIIFKNSEPN